MLSVGIDVAKRSYQACVLDDSGQMVGHSFKFPSPRGGVDTLVSILQELGSPATVVIEGQTRKLNLCTRCLRTQMKAAKTA